VNPALVAAVWALVTLDCGLIGYRLAMGRMAILDKRRYHQRATVRAGLAGQAPLAVVTLLAVFLCWHHPATGRAFDGAMRRFLVVGGAYAALILATSALCGFRSVTLRTISSVVVFGPLTLLRPVVVVATVVFAVGPHPTPALVVVGVLIAVPGVGIEPLLDRRIARRLLRPGRRTSARA